MHQISSIVGRECIQKTAYMMHVKDTVPYLYI